MSSNRLSILVVDDEEDIANVFKVIITEFNYNVIAFTDPLEAFDHFKSSPQKYSLIITDLKMPRMNGIDLIKKIRELNKTVVIYIITAFAVKMNTHLTRQDVQSLNIEKILEKPIDFSVLKDMIYRSLNFND